MHRPQNKSVNLLRTNHETMAQRKMLLVAIFFALLVGLFATLGAAASYRAAASGNSVFFELGQLPGLSDIRRFGFSNPEPESSILESTTEDRINLLLLGVGGEGHDGSQLTDTMILVSLDVKEPKVSLLSIPRDLSYPSGDHTFQKINHLNAFFELDHPGEGAKYTADAVSDLLRVPIQFVVRIDFNGFAKFIDALDGVPVEIENSFTDESYPAENRQYRTIKFQAGPEHLNGERALEFVRSRHGNHGEGSDFARSRRQQIVLQAVRDKLLSMGTLGNPKKIAQLLNILSGHVQTNLSAWDIVSLAPMAAKLDSSRISMRVLTDGPDGELTPATIEGEYMLFPQKPDWSEIRRIAANPFVTKEQELEARRPATAVVLEIKNGTNYEGYAFQVSQKMKSYGYSVPSIENATHRGYTHTILYDLTNGSKPEEVVRLKTFLDADIGIADPSSITETGERVIYTEDLAQEIIHSSSTDFLVILGESSLGLIQPYYEPL